jgi:hypothetical protein
MRPKALPELRIVRALLAYDPDTGIFIWKVARSGSARPGTRAGFIHRTGYRIIDVLSQQCLAHRLAWLLVHGEPPASHVDHVNRDRDDNRIANLRLATNSQNRANSGLSRNNTTGFKGVSVQPRCPQHPYIAAIRHQGRDHFLGHFATAREAGDAYAEAQLSLFGEFARSE